MEICTPVSRSYKYNVVSSFIQIVLSVTDVHNPPQL